MELKLQRVPTASHRSAFQSHLHSPCFFLLQSWTLATRTAILTNKQTKTESLQVKVRRATSAEKVEEPQEKKTKADNINCASSSLQGNSVSLLTMYEEILQENNTKELTQSQAHQQVMLK